MKYESGYILFLCDDDDSNNNRPIDSTSSSRPAPLVSPIRYDNTESKDNYFSWLPSSGPIHIVRNFRLRKS